ncbi:5-methyltetrahydrofolate--homocysteine methyltransferase [Peptoclostridium litorale DSM 5388]|uniref:Methionine synthase n=1 Tax=Peptoclostridium litorale DSM 5388 TaxID=1121324 RepID=A0A069RIB0_PEPLI|nr:homocysteine S-methyltransferase family protein [Peptoclostridium litorale]KDR96741.1 methionine synthase MetH [Peptoclostridium litorale DSM 5388]SIN67267.1 5-methyltetrahydrofolate--homocysteine methyltransferase [Peptoclostridium litorale DSM 5388]
MDLREILENRHLIFDGAMGTMLQKSGIKPGELPESYNMEKRDIVLGIHREYVSAGAQVIITNTFGANRYKLDESPYSVEEIVKSAVSIAREAAGEDGLVALDIGPIGQMMEPIGTLSFEQAYEIFKEQVIAGEGADLILIETISDIYEAKAAVLAAKENSDLPVLCTLTFQENGRTLTGTNPLAAVNILEGLGCDAIGMNCSLGPVQMMPIVKDIVDYSSIPVMVQPNAGLPRIEDGKTVYDVEPYEFASYIAQMADMGVAMFGGCCGTTPEFIKSVKEALNGKKPKPATKKNLACVCSSTKAVVIGQGVSIIGERINPTGKKRLREAIKAGDFDYVVSEAISQKETGSDILDVNMGVPGIDEVAAATRAVRELQSVIDLPLQIDSSNPDAIEAAVRIYNGKAIINSVNGKDESLEKILPIAKKYGACVIGLTLDEEGLPETAQKRVEIAQKIVNRAKEHGIDEKDIIIDCLVLTASAQQEAVMETLKAIPLVKEKLGVRTTLGASNVSYGLPQRGIINSTYLAMALSYGLDAPITDSTNQRLMEAIRSFRVITNQDPMAEDYIRAYGGDGQKAKETLSKAADEKRSLKSIILNGMKDESYEATKSALNERDAMDIVNNELIAALDEVGEKYEKGDIFLPQLIRSAETVKMAFDAVKEKIVSEGSESISKGKMILATVKGDIHDIGKNIVKILLENYGYDVIDLGRDVAPETIVQTAKDEDIRLVGLSALMTTTVSSMEDTINLIKDQNLDCKVMVGGAVLNPEYAKEIGADYYSKDAKEAVEVARRVFEN